MDIFLIEENGESKVSLRNVDVILRKSVELIKNWRSFARELNLDEAELHSLNRKVNLETLQMNEIPFEILKIWKEKNGAAATITMLRSALANCKLLALKEELETMIVSHEHNQEESVRFVWQLREQSLKELLKDRVSQDAYKHIQKLMQTYQFSDLVVPIIREQLLPLATPMYYISRTMVSYGNEVDQKILNTDAEEINDSLLLFKGISKPELLRRTDYKKTVCFSGEEIGKAVKLIVLEYEGDYESICRETTKPVHLIEFNDGKLYWKKSSSMLQIMQPFLSQYTLSEEEMSAKITSAPLPHSCIITDSPGMGKTLILANWANKIMINANSKNLVVLFIVLQEFIQYFGNSMNSSVSAIQMIADYSSTNEITKLILETLLKSKTLDVYLFLDGYDEVAQEKLDLADTFLATVKQSENFKIFASTRPHLKKRLEGILGSHSIEIQRFNKANQLQFLKQYWINQGGAINNDNLQQFAQHFLEALENELSDKEKEIAGIPLQCRMIADVYAEDAVRYSKMRPGSKITIKITSLFDVYKKLVDLKFSRISDSSIRKKYIHFHVYQSILLLFPDWIPQFDSYLSYSKSIEESDLYSIGLMEKSPQHNTPRFVHRTYAEYLLVEFLIETYRKVNASAKLLFINILGHSGVKTELRYGAPTVYKFKYPVLAYFTNMYYKYYVNLHQKIRTPVRQKSNTISLNDLAVALIASCCADLENCYDLVVNYLSSMKISNLFSVLQKMSHAGSPWDELIISYKYMLHLLVEFSTNPQLVMKVMSDINVVNNMIDVLVFPCSYTPSPIMHGRLIVKNSSPLHAAVFKGDINVVMVLINQYRDQVKGMSLLLHTCVYLSAKNSASTIAEKISIIDLLLKQKRSWLEEVYGEDATTPLLQTDVHINLLRCLVEHGASINAYSKYFGTILHRVDLNTATLRWALNNGFSLINGIDKMNKTPLMVAFTKLGNRVDVELIELFYEAGADFNAQDNLGNSILFYALRLSDQIDIIQKVIDYGANINHKNMGRENAAHIIINTSKRSEILSSKINLLIMKGFAEINRVNLTGFTPLLCCFSFIKSLDEDLLGAFRMANADFNTQDKSGNSILFYAIKASKNVSFIRKLLDYGVDVYHKNVYGDTVIQLLKKFTVDSDVKQEIEKYFTCKHFAEVVLNSIDTLLLYMYNSERFRTLSVETLTFFYQRGDDLNVEDWHGNSVLFNAIKTHSDIQLISKIIDYGVHINHQNSNGECVIDMVIRYTRALATAMNLIKLFKHKGYRRVDLSCNNSTYWGFVLLRVLKKFKTIDSKALEWFHEIGTDFNAEDRNKYSVLFYAIEYSKDTHDCVDLIRQILDYGANVNHTNVFERNAAHYVLRFIRNPERVLDILKMLKHEGFNGFDHENLDGLKPLDYYYFSTVSQEQNKAIIQFLTRETHGIGRYALSKI